jgi:hypothetical protein
MTGLGKGIAVGFEFIATSIVFSSGHDGWQWILFWTMIVAL